MGVAKNANGHGGARPGAGRKRNPLPESLERGKHPSLIAVVPPPKPRKEPVPPPPKLKEPLKSAEHKKTKTTKVVDRKDELPTVPEAKEFLADVQKDGTAIGAEQYYRELWEWLCARSCEHLFTPMYLQNFAMQQARYAQLERQITRVGFLAKGAKDIAVINPLEKAAMERLRILNQMYFVIESSVRANCTESFNSLPQFSDPIRAMLE
jgi:hypothetical protein